MNRLPPFDFAQGREARNLYFREKAEGKADAKFNWDITGEEMTDVLRFVFLELGRFRKRQMELETMYDKWLWLLGYMHELESIPENFTEPLFKRMFLLSELGEFTAEDAHARGLAEGLMTGREEGKQTKTMEIAKKLKEAGISVSIIAEATGLTEEQVVVFYSPSFSSSQRISLMSVSSMI